MEEAIQKDRASYSAKVSQVALVSTSSTGETTSTVLASTRLLIGVCARRTQVSVCMAQMRVAFTLNQPNLLQLARRHRRRPMLKQVGLCRPHEARRVRSHRAAMVSTSGMSHRVGPQREVHLVASLNLTSFAAETTCAIRQWGSPRGTAAALSRTTELTSPITGTAANPVAGTTEIGYSVTRYAPRAWGLDVLTRLPQVEPLTALLGAGLTGLAESQTRMLLMNKAKTRSAQSKIQSPLEDVGTQPERATRCTHAVICSALRTYRVLSRRWRSSARAP
jgi:hypothetical protein